MEEEVVKAQELLKVKEQENIDAFMQEYRELSKKYGLGLSPVFTNKASGSFFELEVVKV